MKIKLGEHPLDLAFHPSDQLVAAGLITGDLILSRYTPDSPPQRVLKIDTHQESCRAVRFTDDGQAILTGSADCSILATNVETGSPITRRENFHRAPIYRIVSSTEGTFASGDDEGCIKVWDTRQYNCCFKFKAHEEYISDMIFTSDSKKLIGTSGDGTLSVCDLRNNTVQRSSKISKGELLSVVIMKNGQEFICGTRNGYLLLYSSGSFEHYRKRIKNQFRSPVDAMLKLDEERVITGSEKGFINLVSIPNEKFQRIVHHSKYPVERLAFSHDRKFLGSISYDQTLKLWDLEHFLEDYGIAVNHSAVVDIDSAARKSSKGKREAEEVIEKEVSKKKQKDAEEVTEKEGSKKKQKKGVAAKEATVKKVKVKTEKDVEEVIEKEVSKKKQKKGVAAKEATVKKAKVKTEKKKIAKKQGSSDDSSSSESEEEQKVVNRKVAGAAKNGSVSAPKKKEESSEESSSEEDSDSSDEDVAAAKKAPAAAVKNVTAKNKSRHGWSLVAMDTGVDVKANARKSVLSSEKKEPNTPSTQPQTLGSKTLFIQNLSCNTEKADVENFFKECVDVHFATYPDGALKGFGLVEFATVEAAQKARDEKNGQILGSRRVYLDIASVRGAYTPQSRDASSKRRSIGSQAGRMIHVRGFDKNVEENQVRKPPLAMTNK